MAPPIGRHRHRARPELEELLLVLQGRGLCMTDPDLWFPGKGQSTRAAKAVCAQCPVKVPCLEYALDTNQRWGVWGGLSERERRRLKRSQVA